VLPGIMGLLQANEVIKLIVGIGETLVGRLVMFEALTTTFIELKLRRGPNCPVCSHLYAKPEEQAQPAAASAVASSVS
jgi:sulfur-carrier protein adenylyltransferase/sulfurtransferase